jgi:hypothetical protein
MNNLRGINAGMGYCHITELDILFCCFSIIFYFSYIIYIINKKQVKDN